LQRKHLPLLLIACFCLVSQFALGACDVNATTTNFASQLAAASPGQTLCLTSGTYSGWSGAAGVTKTSPGVRITPAVGATVVMPFSFAQNSPVIAWLIFDGITFRGGDMSGPAHNLTFQNSTFSDKINFYGSANNNACGNCAAMNNNNIVFDNDLFNMSANQSGIGGYEGRVNILGNSLPAGVTIKNSKFTTGCADGVQSVGGGGNGFTFGPGNEFYNIQQGSCGQHVDSFQFVGSSSPGPTITGNYFHNNSTGIVGYDNANTAIISNNVIMNIVQDPITMGGVNSNTIIEHNTVDGAIACSSNHTISAPCTAIIRNNISAGYNGGGAPTNFQPSFFDYNLCTSGSCAFNGFGPGAHSLVSIPTFVAGGSPTTYAGYALAAGSLGNNAASDGTDIGINASGTTSGSTGPTAPTNLAAVVQ
jgi:parallel beta-helix repeat protein